MSENTERLERMAVERDCAAKRLEAMSRNDDYVPFSFAGHADREEAAFLLSLIPLVEAGERAHKPCAKCGKPVCILEDGGPGAELSDGRWACSEECWDALAGPPDAPSVVRLHGLWRTDMENAPTDTLLAVRAGGMTFDASLRLMDDGCWAWVAEHEEVHPWCWTDGRCWARNENNKPSAPVTHWQPLPPAPKGGA